MRRSVAAIVCAIICIGTVVSCSAQGQQQVPASPPAASPAALPESPESTAATGPDAAPVEPGVQQRVKNLCLDRLKAEAAGPTPAAGQQSPAKVTLVKVAFRGEVRAILLPANVPGYELGIDYVYKVGNNDANTGTKYCRANLADSTVAWQWTASH